MSALLSGTWSALQISRNSQSSPSKFMAYVSGFLPIYANWCKTWKTWEVTTNVGSIIPSWLAENSNLKVFWCWQAQDKRETTANHQGNLNNYKARHLCVVAIFLIPDVTRVFILLKETNLTIHSEILNEIKVLYTRYCVYKNRRLKLTLYLYLIVFPKLTKYKIVFYFEN